MSDDRTYDLICSRIIDVIYKYGWVYEHSQDSNGKHHIKFNTNSGKKRYVFKIEEES